MPYTIKEIVYTLQGEGAQAGRPAVFCRFAGCNLWSGEEADRATAVCDFCDTDIVGTDGIAGGEFATASDLATAIRKAWPENITMAGKPLVVCTGGEPLLQMDDALVAALHDVGFELAVETNGTIVPPNGIDWLCVSPKAGAACKVHAGDELKIVVPQAGLDPQAFAPFDFRHFFLQPMDGPQLEENRRWAIDYCLRHPQWSLSLQRHKLWGLP